MWIYISLAVLITLISIVIAICVIYFNKFQIAIIKISEAEENISLLLEKKLELILRINKFIESKKKECRLVGIESVEKEDFSNFEFNKELNKYNKKIIEITNYNKEISFNKKEQEVLKELNQLNIHCLAAQKYYNDNVVKYNELMKCFPSNLVGKLLKYDIKEFYSNEKEEIFEILKK